MSAERLVTVSIILFGMIFLLWVVPAQVEEVTYGRIVPSSLPIACLFIITAFAVVQFFVSKHKIDIHLPTLFRAIFFTALMAASVWLMRKLGFVIVSPILALAVMIFVGEKRWYWLVLGGPILPIGIWFIVVHVLDRPLP